MAKDPVEDDETSLKDKAVMSTIALRVRETRQNAKLKQSELAKMIGTSQPYIFLVESAEANVTVKTLIRLAQALNVEPVDLLVDSQILPNLDKERAKEIYGLIGASIVEVQATAHKMQEAADNMTKLHNLLQQAHDLLAEHRKE